MKQKSKSSRLIKNSATALTRSRERFWFVAVLVLAGLVRLAFDFGRGYPGDIDLYLAETWKIVTYGIHSAYQNLSGVPASDNPPVLLYPFWLLGELYKHTLSASFPPTWMHDAPPLRFLLRLPSLVADLLIGALIFWELQQKRLSFKARLAATCAYLFNPAVIFDSAYWGQTAAVHTLFMLFALICAERRAYAWAGIALTTAVLTKPQAIAIVPLVLVLVLRERGWVRFGVAGLLTTLMIVTPFLVSGNIRDVSDEYLKSAQYHPFLSANAHNLWWLVTGGEGWQSDTVPFGGISFRVAGLMLFAWATLLSVVVTWRNREMLFLAAAFQSLAFFTLNTQIHENHMLPMLAPLLIVAACEGRFWYWMYGALSLTAFANMALHDPNLIRWLGYSPSAIFGGPELVIPRWLNALAQAALFVVFICRLFKAAVPVLHVEARQSEAR